MNLSIAPLFSGSGGNATYIGTDSAGVLVDAGLSGSTVIAALKQIGKKPEDLSGILVTHEHLDHISGLAVLTKKLRVPLVSSGPTCRQLCYKVPFVEDLVQQQEPGTGVQIGSLWVESFPTPHDAAGSVGYSIAGDSGRMVLATDLGYVTEEVKRAAAGCDLLLCEANHDEDWVRSGPYPYYLKQRILGDRGHLCNEAGAELAAFAVGTGTKAVVLAHLSSENNTPGKAYRVAERRLSAMGAEVDRDVDLAVAPRSELSATYCVERGNVFRTGTGKGAVLC